MAISSTTVINVAPELSTETTDRINYFITEAARYVNTSTWGNKSDFAHALYTAHLMTISNLSGSGGAVQSEKVGDLARTFAVSSSTEADISSTSYGRQFLAMRKSLLISPIVLG